MAKFTQGDVDGSIADFDAVIAAAPGRAPYMWQRGLSLYYAERLREGSAQFRRDVAVNPNDTEEAGVGVPVRGARQRHRVRARARRISSPSVATRARYMRAAYALFAGTGDEDALRAVAANGGAAEDFYSWLYVGLYREAKGRRRTARKTRCSPPPRRRTDRARGDYMAALAEVHAKRRGWSVCDVFLVLTSVVVRFFMYVAVIVRRLHRCRRVDEYAALPAQRRRHDSLRLSSLQPLENGLAVIAKTTDLSRFLSDRSGAPRRHIIGQRARWRTRRAARARSSSRRSPRWRWSWRWRSSSCSTTSGTS
jgi:hypothetical protein